MNCVCDLTQFVVVVPVPGMITSIIAKYFMQEVLLKFGICHLVVMDDGTPFKGAFVLTCDALHLKYACVAMRNHKAVLVEKFHRFLNKAVTIAVEDRKTLGCFTEVGIVAGYAWNSAPIDGTDIIRSIPAIGRELRFHIDISSVTLPQLTTNQVDSIVNYIRLTDSSKHLVTDILKLSIEDRRTVHRERINNQYNIVSFDVGDVLLARREVQSNKSTNKVGKLCYQVRGPFVIVKPTVTGGYMVTKFGKSDGPKLKYMAEDLYVLPPTLLLCDPVDGSNIKYINHSHPCS